MPAGRYSTLALPSRRRPHATPAGSPAASIITSPSRGASVQTVGDELVPAHGETLCGEARPNHASPRLAHQLSVLVFLDWQRATVVRTSVVATYKLRCLPSHQRRSALRLSQRSLNVIQSDAMQSSTEWQLQRTARALSISLLICRISNSSVKLVHIFHLLLLLSGSSQISKAC